MTNESRPFTHKVFRLEDGAAWRWKMARRKAYEDESWTLFHDTTIDFITAFLMIEEGRGEDVTALPADYTLWADHFRSARRLHHDRIERIAVELLMIARVPNEEISSQTGIHVDVLDVYEACYFDVRDILDVRGAISSTVLHSRYGDPVDPMRTELLRLSYVGERIVANTCIDYLRHHGEPDELATEAGIARKQIDLLVQASGTPFEPWLQFEHKTFDAIQQSMAKRVNLPTIASLLRVRLESLTSTPEPDVNFTQSAEPANEVAVHAGSAKKSA